MHNMPGDYRCDPAVEADIRPARLQSRRGLQKLCSARRRQGLSIRCIAQRLGLTVGEVGAQGDGRSDLLLSEIFWWQGALEVPVQELLQEPDDALSSMVSMRAQLLKVMKTAMA